MYVTIPAGKWNDVKRALAEKLEANRVMGDYYESHRAEVERV
jgi:hypothetical protein